MQKQSIIERGQKLSASAVILALVLSFTPIVEFTGVEKAYAAPVSVTTASPQSALPATGQPTDRTVFRSSAGEYLMLYHDTGRLYYRTSTDSGATWGSATQIKYVDNFTGWAFSGYMDDSNNIYVTYRPNRGSSQHVFMMKLAYSAGSWSNGTERTVESAGSSQLKPNIIKTAAGTLWVSYTYFDGTNYDVRVKSSTDDGATWSSATAISSTSTVASNATSSSAFGLYDDQPVLVYEFNYSSGGCQFRAKAYDGASWGSEATVDSTSCTTTSEFSLTTVGSAVHYVGGRAGITSLKHSVYTGSWSTTTTVNSSATDSYDPQITTDGSSVWLFYVNRVGASGTDYDVYYKRYNGSSWSGSGAITVNSTNNRYPRIPLKIATGATIPIMYVSGTTAPFTIYSDGLSTLDTTAPTISDISSGTPGATSATITWTTDENADSQVEYGTTASYGSTTTLNSTLSTSHSEAITGLTPSTTYHYRVKSEDASGNLATSSDQTFTTDDADVTAPTRSAGSPSGTLAAGTASTSLSLTTNESATCKYGTTANTAYASISSTFDTTGGTSHSQTLSGLSNGQSYSYYVRCQDGSSNANTDDYTISFSIASSGTTLITLKGATYQLRAHPRVLLDGTGGTLTTSVSDPDGSGPLTAPKADASNIAWKSMLDNVNGRTSTYTDEDQYFRFEDGQLVWQAALVWQADNTNTAAKDMALYWLNNVEKAMPIACVESRSKCNNPEEVSDNGSRYLAFWSQAFSVMRSEMTTEERQLFAQKMLNDRREFGGIDSSSSTSCTNPTATGATLEGTLITVTISGSNEEIVTASEPIFGTGASQIGVGDWITAIGAGAFRKVKTITSSTVAEVHSNPFYTGGFRGAVTDAQLYHRPGEWSETDCGLVWVVKHHDYSPRVISGTGSSYTTFYPGGVFNGGGLSATAAESGHNLIYTKTWGYILAFLALIDDDVNASSRSGRQLTLTYDYWHDYVWEYAKSYWSGLEQSASYYGASRARQMLPETAIAVTNSVDGALATDLTDGDWFKKTVIRYYMSYMPYATNEWIKWGQDSVSRGDLDPFQLRGLTLVNYLYPTSIEAKYANWWMRNVWAGSTSSTQGWTEAQLETSNCSSCSTFFLFTNPDDAVESLASAPLQYLFRDTDRGVPYGEMASMISRTNFPAYNSGSTAKGGTLTEIYAHWIGNIDHVGNGNPGSYKIVKREYLLAEDYGNGKVSAATAGYTNSRDKSNYIEVGGQNNLISPTQAVPQKPTISKADVVDPSNRYAYALANLSGAYTATAALNRAHRHFVHFKKTGTGDAIIAYDNVVTTSAKRKKTFLHYPNNGQTSEGTTAVSGSLVTSTGASATIFTHILKPGGDSSIYINNEGSYSGGVGQTHRVSVCASTDGSTCDDTNTTAEFMMVHIPQDGLTGTAPNASLLTTIDDDYRGVQVDTTIPKIALFPRNGTGYTSASFTTTHAGTGQILIAGLVAGTYDVSKDGVTIVDNYVVTSTGGDLYAEATSGAFTVGLSSDMTAPVISSVTGSSITTTSTTITWTTNEASTSQVEYGTTDGYGSTTTLDSSLVTSHSVNLSGLSAGTLYYFRVKSGDAAGNIRTSTGYTLTTTAASDTTAPGVSLLSPADDATDVSATVNLVITFDEATRAGTGTLAIKRTSDDSIVETITVSGALLSGNGSTQLTINPTVTLSGSISYYVTWTANAFKDASGNHVAVQSSTTYWSFTTTAAVSSSSSSSVPVSSSSSAAAGGGGGGGGRGRGPIIPSSIAAGSSRSSQEALSSASPAETDGNLRMIIGGKFVTYRDVPQDAWFAKYIAELIQKGIASGYEDARGNNVGIFGPANDVTYAEIVKMALEASSNVSNTDVLPRNQSAQGHWAEKYIVLAEKHRLSVYISTLDIDAPASRGEVIQTLLEAFDLTVESGLKNSYSDLRSSHPYAPAILTATRLGIISGDTSEDGSLKNTVRPNDPVNRAEVAKIISELLRL